jgi:sec-independent protein translocase protein TatB
MQLPRLTVIRTDCRSAIGLFDLSITKLLVLGVLALLIFGPEQLPKMAAQAGGVLRDLRRLAERARADLTDSLGPEFSDFDFNDLNPKHFVRKHLLDDESFGWSDGNGSQADAPDDFADFGAELVPGELPPYDAEAT